jgi:hypothetical protein
MVEFAVLLLQNPAGAQRPDAFLCDGINKQAGKVTPTQTTVSQSVNFSYLTSNIPSSETPFPASLTCKVRTRPFGRSYYNVHSYTVHGFVGGF